MTDLANLQFTEADVQVLLRLNPLADEQIKVIILTRMMKEKDAELEKLRKAISANGLSPVTKDGGV